MASMPAPLVRRRYRFYNGMSLLIAAIVFAGFYRTFYLFALAARFRPCRRCGWYTVSPSPPGFCCSLRRRPWSRPGGLTSIAGLALRALLSRWGWSYWAPFWPLRMRARGGRRQASRLGSF